MLTSSLPTANLTHKKVLVRADLNVPLSPDGKILDDYRLLHILPTLDLIQKKGGQIILLTHIGRPKNHEQSLSTKHLIPWFEKHGYAMRFCHNIASAQQTLQTDKKSIILLENLRFFSGEKNNDAAFARELAALGDYFVNDAFGSLHRQDTSITLVPTLFDKEHRTIGLLVEKELAVLTSLLNSPEQPFVVILGGGKVQDKLPLIEHLMDKIHALLLGPAIVFTFLKALGKPVGASLVDDEALPMCRNIIALAQTHGTNIYFPVDYIAAHGSFAGPLLPQPISADDFLSDTVGISIGPKTVELYTHEINTAKTIFYNGLMGDVKRPETLVQTRALFNAIAQSPATTIIGGGDSVAATREFGLEHQIDFLSTGGGVTLTFLSGKELPGLKPFSLIDGTKSKQT